MWCVLTTKDEEAAAARGRENPDAPRCGPNRRDASRRGEEGGEDGGRAAAPPTPPRPVPLAHAPSPPFAHAHSPAPPPPSRSVPRAPSRGPVGRRDRSKRGRSACALCGWVGEGVDDRAGSGKPPPAGGGGRGRVRSVPSHAGPECRGRGGGSTQRRLRVFQPMAPGARGREELRGRRGARRTGGGGGGGRGGERSGAVAPAGGPRGIARAVSRRPGESGRGTGTGTGTGRRGEEGGRHRGPRGPGEAFPDAPLERALSAETVSRRRARGNRSGDKIAFSSALSLGRSALNLARSAAQCGPRPGRAPGLPAWRASERASRGPPARSTVTPTHTVNSHTDTRAHPPAPRARPRSAPAPPFLRHRAGGPGRGEGEGGGGTGCARVCMCMWHRHRSPPKTEKARETEREVCLCVVVFFSCWRRGART